MWWGGECGGTQGNWGELRGTRGEVQTGFYKLLGVSVLILLLAYSALGNLHPDHLLINDADVTAARLAEYEWFTGNIGSTVSAEYLPEWVRPRPPSAVIGLFQGDRNQAVLWAGDSRTLQERRTDQQTWHITVPPGEATRLMLPTLYWPGWQARTGRWYSR